MSVALIGEFTDNEVRRQPAINMATKIDVEQRITELELAVGCGIFPGERESYEDQMRTSPHEHIRNNPTLRYLMFLEQIKSEMDNNTRLWNKLRNWD